ncbi:MAG: hypothetical protein JOZ15_02065, partial [Acidobacteria bacterium]|nr:hypothetical protein [Acidobacteriota bacterium]
MHEPGSTPAIQPDPEAVRLVLAGVGHANLEVLRRLSLPARRAAAPSSEKTSAGAGRVGATGVAGEAGAHAVPAFPGAGVDLTVISPEPWHCYSGMVPGYLRGIYRLDEIAVELAPLVRRAGGRLRLGMAAGFDPRRRVVKVEAPAPAAVTMALANEVAGRTDLSAGGDHAAGGLSYDFIAFAVGSDAAGAAAAMAGAGGAVLSCKP